MPTSKKTKWYITYKFTLANVSGFNCGYIEYVSNESSLTSQLLLDARKYIRDKNKDIIWVCIETVLKMT